MIDVLEISIDMYSNLTKVNSNSRMLCQLEINNPGNSLVEAVRCWTLLNNDKNQ